MADKKCAVCDWVGQLRRGYCKRHYRRFMKTGDPLQDTNTKGMTIEQKLLFFGWTEVVRLPEIGPCWEWNGGMYDTGDPNSYGRVSINGKGHIVSRVAHKLWNGPIPDGYQIMHACDNPPCMNPAHLSAGTGKENAEQRDARGRHNPARGEDSGTAKLREVDIHVIRSRYDKGERLRDIAEPYGVTIGLICMIGKRHRWTHVPEREANH